MRPMLATGFREAPEDTLRRLRAEGDVWDYEIKWDGVRVLSEVKDGQATLTNRNGVDVTARYADVAFALQDGFRTGHWAFDGEVVAFADGKPSFSLLQRRDRLTNPAKIAAAIRTIPVTYILFDCLRSDGWDLTGHVLEARRLLLDDAFMSLPTSTPLQISAPSPQPVVMWKFVMDNDLEGLIAKHRYRVYTQGRSDAWVKVKRVEENTFTVTGYEEGEGKHEGRIGALHLAVYGEGGMQSVGKVGTGFTDAEREEIKARIDSGEKLEVDVQYLEMTKDGSLRFPTFRGVRSA